MTGTQGANDSANYTVPAQFLSGTYEIPVAREIEPLPSQRGGWAHILRRWIYIMRLAGRVVIRTLTVTNGGSDG